MTPTFAALEPGSSSDAAPRLNGLAEQRHRLDAEAREYADRVRGEIPTLLGSLQWFEEGFARILRDVAAGKAVELQGEREPILDAFQRRLALVLDACRLGRHAERMTGRALPDLSRLEAEAGDFGQRLMSLLVHWQTAEDLTGLTEEKLRHRVSPLDFRRLLTPEQRDAILRRSAELAEEDYRTDPELLSFEAFGEKDLYDEYPDEG